MLLTQIFYRLLYISLVSSIFILFAILFRRILKKRSNHAMCIIWLFVMLRLIWPFTISTSKTESAAFFPAFEDLHSEQTVNTKQAKTEISDLRYPSNNYSDVPSANEETLNVSSFENNEAKANNIYFVLLQVCAYIWLSGLIVILTNKTIAYVKLRKALRFAVIDDGLFISDSITTPCVCGIIHPNIYIPSSLSVSDRRMIVLHEQTHKELHDNLFRLFSDLVLSLHWFNPLVWLACHFLDRDLELRCDDKVVSVINNSERKMYLNLLLVFSHINLESQKKHQLSFLGGFLKERMENATMKKSNVKIVVPAVITCAVIVCVTTMLLQGEHKGIAQSDSVEKPNITGTQLADAEISKRYFPKDYSGYRYPVLPTMSTWPYGNHGDMVNACQVPEDELSKMTTMQLVETVLYYPLAGDTYTYNSMETAYDLFKNYNNAFLELSQREDRVKCLNDYFDTHQENIYKELQKWQENEGQYVIGHPEIIKALLVKQDDYKN